MAPAQFRGPKNVQLGFDPVWASARYDHETRDYVIELDGDDVDRFRKVADLYGYREVPDSEQPDVEVTEQPKPEPVDGEVVAPDPVQSDGHERDYVDLAHAIDNARDDVESDDSDDVPDPEPTPEPEAPKRRPGRPRKTQE